ncbi:polysaccharide biosynthesis tyrosine autokinase [Inquilinus sp. KBS0705]|nr:polysaccharide biosynthesis tyrosine autokinase [Inquilinus sp. KBS0705]
MSKQQTQITTLALPAGGNDPSSNLSILIKKYLYHWPLFVVGVVLALTAAYFYLKLAKPVYPIVATLEFKTPTASSASLTVNQSSTEQQLDPIDKPVIVENEIEVMKSKKLIYQVVDNLQLWVSYYQKDGLRSVDLYGRNPVKFQFVKKHENVGPAGQVIDVILNTNSFILKNKIEGDKTYNYGSPVATSFGTWKLDATDDLQGSIGKDLKIIVQDPDLVTDGYQGGIKVELENKDAPFVNLTSTDQVPQRGKDILNSLLALYLQYAMEDKNKLSQKTLKFIDFRLDSLKKELNSIEAQFEQYKSSNNITDINAQAQSYRDLQLANTRSLNDINLQLSILNSLERYANSSQNSQKMPAINANLGDPTLVVLYDRLTQLHLDRQKLLATTPEANPLFIPIDKQIVTLKNDFKDKIGIIKSSLLAQKKQIESVGTGVRSDLKMIPGQDKEYSSLKRLQETKENVYKFLLEKHEQVALRYASSISDSEIVDDAHAGKVKWPIVPLVYGLAFIIGLGAAAGLLFARESFNDLITSRKQIEDETEIPILGELSYQTTDKQIVVTEGRSKFAIGEQFRVLRTNLYHLHGNSDKGRVTLFTSSVSGEGKSFVSSNLAVTLAYAGRKSIILEMDLRKPKVSISFGLSPDNPGISDYLAELTDDVKRLIQPSGIPGLDILSCGPIQPNPSELLEKDRLDQLIEKLKEMYDDVVIDSPPIHLVTDALIISRVADASLYVVRQGYTHKYELEFVNGINEANRFPKFTIVFNGINKDSGGYGGYGYGYGYGGYGGYSNSYNSYATKEKTTFRSVMKGVLSRF